MYVWFARSMEWGKNKISMCRQDENISNLMLSLYIASLIIIIVQQTWDRIGVVRCIILSFFLSLIQYLVSKNIKAMFGF